MRLSFSKGAREPHKVKKAISGEEKKKKKCYALSFLIMISFGINSRTWQATLESFAMFYNNGL